MSAIIPIVVGLAVAVVYTSVVWRRQKTEFWSWLHSVMAIVVSMLLGIPVAIAIFYDQQKSIAQQERSRHLELVTLELSNVQHRLQDDKRANITTRSGRKFQLQIVNLETDVLQAAGMSGLFGEKESFRMLDLSSSMRFWNTKTEGLLGALNSASDDPAQDSRIEWFMTNLDKSRSGIINGTTALAKDLNITLKKGVKEYY